MPLLLSGSLKQLIKAAKVQKILGEEVERKSLYSADFILSVLAQCSAQFSWTRGVISISYFFGELSHGFYTRLCVIFSLLIP